MLRLTRYKDALAITGKLPVVRTFPRSPLVAWRKVRGRVLVAL